MSWSVTHLFPHARPEQAASTFAGATFSASKSGFSGQASLSGILSLFISCSNEVGVVKTPGNLQLCFDLWVVSVCHKNKKTWWKKANEPPWWWKNDFVSKGLATEAIVFFGWLCMIKAQFSSLWVADGFGFILGFVLFWKILKYPKQKWPRTSNDDKIPNIHETS